MYYLQKLIFLSILFFTGSLAAGPLEDMGQEYGGEMVTFTKMQGAVKQAALDEGLKCLILDDPRSIAYVFPGQGMAVTRGLLYEIKNEGELKELTRQAAGAKDSGPLHLTHKEGGSDEAFSRAFAPFWESRGAWDTLIAAFEASDRGEYDKAMTLGETVLQALGEEPHLLRLLALTSAGVGNAPGALIELKKALRLNPDYHRFYLLRGAIFLKVGVIDGAKTDFQDSLRLYPTEEAKVFLGKIALLEGHYDEAVRYFDQSSHRIESANYREAAKMMGSLSSRGSADKIDG